MAQVKELPILFSGAMVRAILDGRKAQTRRLLKVQPIDVLPMNVPNQWVTLMTRDPNHGQVIRCRYGQPGDRLWVRETLQRGVQKVTGFDFIGYTTQYQATITPVPYAEGARVGWCGHAIWQWKKQKVVPSIHMPRWACRILLAITGVRVERLQDISETDADAEGCHVDDGYIVGEFASSREGFAYVWDSLNGKRALWDTNPWVWVIDFKRVEVPA